MNDDKGALIVQVQVETKLGLVYDVLEKMVSHEEHAASDDARDMLDEIELLIEQLRS